MVCTEQLFAVSARAAQTHLRESLSAKSDPLQTAIVLDFAHCLCVWNPRMRSTLSSWQRSINCQLGDPRQRILPPSLAHSLHRLSVAFASSALRYIQVNTTIYAQPNRTILNWTELSWTEQNWIERNGTPFAADFLTSMHSAQLRFAFRALRLRY